MGYHSVQVEFSESEVSTLDDLAKSLKESYGWESYRINDSGSYIVFKAEDSDDGTVKEGYVGPSGFAYHLEEDEDDQFGEAGIPWEEYDVNWDEDFDGWSNHVWGSNEEGETVMVHD